jgi:hypothetical protein
MADPPTTENSRLLEKLETNENEISLIIDDTLTENAIGIDRSLISCEEKSFINSRNVT